MSETAWIFDPDLLTLTTTAGGYEYEIDLKTCISASEVLYWIVQIQRKTWATDELVGSLVRIMNNLLDIQGNITHGGRMDVIIDPAKVILEKLKEIHEWKPSELKAMVGAVNA